MSVRSTLSSYSMASQVKVTEQKQLIDELRRELKMARATQSDGQPSIGTQVCTPGTPGNRKRHNSQQLVSMAKEPRSFADVATRPLPIQCTSAQALAQDRVQAQAQARNKLQTQTQHQVNVPGPNHGLVEGIFGIQNKGAIREELEVALETLNGEPFRGTITYLEAKHGIFGGCLGLSESDFENFDGLRFGYKGCPVIIFKLIKAINVDELLPNQYFEFRRKSTRRGIAHVDVFSCKIRGLRPPHSQHQTHERPSSAESMDDGTRHITIEGCEYRVTKEALFSFLSAYGEVTSDILEVIFKDDSSGGSNRTGSYSVTVKLSKDLPQLAPIMGKRVKFYYRGIQKLCPKCFGPHAMKTCNSRKKMWTEYVEDFIGVNTFIPVECYGRWIDIIKKGERRSAGLAPSAPMAPSVNRNPDIRPGQDDTLANLNDFNDESVPPIEVMPASQVTAQWLEKVSNPRQQTERASLGDKDSQAVGPPVESDFKIPVDASEHEEFIERLTMAGSTNAEAEQVIAARKIAFKKATSQYKKTTAKTLKGGQRKTTSNRKLALGSQDNDGY